MGSETGDAASTQSRIEQLERDIAALTVRAETAEVALAKLRRAYTQALEQLQLLRHRLTVAKAERAVAPAEQLAFDILNEKVQQLAKVIDAADAANAASASSSDGAPPEPKSRPKPKGRRDLDASNLPTERVEIIDPELEGKVERIGFEVSSKICWEQGGMRRVEIARVVYKTPVETTKGEPAAAQAQGTTAGAPETQPNVRIVTAPMPKELFPRSLLAPSMIAHVLASKYLMGVPFYRLEQSLALQGVKLDRGTMCRYAENAGATLGQLVLTARDEAFATAFCLSTDATGVSIQPGPLKDRERGPCRKGHFFVVLADRDHIFFEYQEKHTSAAVCSMFDGFTGYIQADAHGIYDALFNGTATNPVRKPPPTEVGCWSHARRYFWEAAVCKHPLGVEGMRRIDAIFAADRLLVDMAPARRKELRNQHVRPLVDAFFAWVEAERATVRERGLVTSALGYAHNQEQPLRRFLEDGRLRMENNSSERALRAVAIGRKNWLFFGSDDHASAAANLFSLVASCKLHGLDPERYLAEVIHVMAYWPRERYLELVPKYWAHTRARLDATELASDVGPITLPAKE